MKREPRPGGRTEAEIRRLVAGYEKSGRTRTVYCAGQGLPVTTLDYCRWRQRRKKPALAEIDLGAAAMRLGRNGGDAQEPLAVVLRNGRRVEIGWGDLGRVAGQSQPLRALIDCLDGGITMFGLTTATRVFAAAGATDMRIGFDGLFGLVRDVLGEDPPSGHLFPFANRDRNRVKTLVWDGSGLWVGAKRLEGGRLACGRKRRRGATGSRCGARNRRCR